MGKILITLGVGLLPLIPATVYFWWRRRASPVQVTKGVILSMTGFNIILVMMSLAISIVWLFSPSSVMASADAQEATTGDPYVTLAAALSTGLAAIGAGIAVSGAGAAAVAAVAQKPDSFGRALIFVGLAEGIAIYGLIISFMVLNR